MTAQAEDVFAALLAEVRRESGAAAVAAARVKIADYIAAVRRFADLNGMGEAVEALLLELELDIRAWKVA